jgi:hypothetical protein
MGLMVDRGKIWSIGKLMRVRRGTFYESAKESLQGPRICGDKRTSAVAKSQRAIHCPQQLAHYFNCHQIYLSETNQRIKSSNGKCDTYIAITCPSVSGHVMTPFVMRQQTKDSFTGFIDSNYMDVS